MEEEKPYTIDSIPMEKLNELFNLFLQKTRKTANTHSPKRLSSKSVRGKHKETAENFMVHIDDYFKKHRGK